MEIPGVSGSLLRGNQHTDGRYTGRIALNALSREAVSFNELELPGQQRMYRDREVNFIR